MKAKVLIVFFCFILIFLTGCGPRSAGPAGKDGDDGRDGKDGVTTEIPTFTIGGWTVRQDEVPKDQVLIVPIVTVGLQGAIYPAKEVCIPNGALLNSGIEVSVSRNVGDSVTLQVFIIDLWDMNAKLFNTWKVWDGATYSPVTKTILPMFDNEGYDQHCLTIVLKPTPATPLGTYEFLAAGGEIDDTKRTDIVLRVTVTE